MRRSIQLMLAVMLQAVPAVYADDPPQFRGIYVPTFSTNSQAACDRVIDDVLDSNINQVLVQVRSRGDAYYYPNREDSTYPNPEPRGEAWSISPSDLDILQYYIDRLHNANPPREVIAWVTTYNSWNRSSPPSSPNHVYNAHPDWLTENSAGVTYDYDNDAPLDPGIPAVQDHLYNVLMDVVRNYDVDGIHFDYIRLLSSDSGYDPVSKAQFKADTGWDYDTQNTGGQLDEVYEHWRRDQIAKLVKRVQQQTMREKPWVDVSAFTVNFTDSVENLAQGYNWWVANDGIDVLYPSAYSSSVSGSVDDWNFVVSKLAQNNDQYTRPLVTALGSYLFLETDPPAPERNLQLVNTLESNARKPDGYVFFAYNALFVSGSPSDDLAQDLFNPGGPMDEWAPVPTIAHKVPFGEETQPPNPPMNLSVTLNGGIPRISFSRPGTAADGDLPVHYRVYRDTDPNVDLYYDNMVMEWWDLDSDRTSFSVDDTQAPGGSIYYAAVAYDDWNNRAVQTTGPVSVSSNIYVIEADPAGQNNGDYQEFGSFSPSSSHSSAEGLTGGIGSRWALPGDTNGRNDRARFTPSGITSGTYDLYVTTYRFGSANAQDVTLRINDAQGTNTTTFDLTSGNCGDTWFPLGQVQLTANSGHYIEIDNATQSNIGDATNSRMNVDAIRLVGQQGPAPEKEPKPAVDQSPVGEPPTEIIIDSHPQSLHYDDQAASGLWGSATYAGYYNSNARFFDDGNFPFDSISVYLVDLPTAGKWAIDGWTRHNTVFARGARYRFIDSSGTVINTSVSQRSTFNDPDNGDWLIDVDGVPDNSAYHFDAGRVYLTIWGNATGNEIVIADALRFRLIEEPANTDTWVLE